MSLNKIFGKQEKLKEEKKLETLANEEATVKGLLTYFKGYCPEFEEQWLDTINKHITYLQSFKITPKIVGKVGKIFSEKPEPIYDSLFSSALIQTCYNQGFNYFKFKKEDSSLFGICLKGEKENPLKIKVNVLTSLLPFYETRHCHIEAETIDGDCLMWGAKDCIIKVCNIQGDKALYNTQNCVVEIEKYSGKTFGWLMQHNIIRSSSKETLSLLKALCKEEKNKFVLTKKL